MGDQPVTKKEFVNLEKLVDRMVKEFDEEKKVVHDELGKKLDAAKVDGNLKNVMTKADGKIEEVRKWFQDEQKLKNEQVKWIYERLDERKTWFDDEKQVVHDQLDGLQKSLTEFKTWVEGELNKLKK